MNFFSEDSKNRIKTDKSLIDKTSINHASLPSEICNNANFGKNVFVLINSVSRPMTEVSVNLSKVSKSKDSESTQTIN